MKSDISAERSAPSKTFLLGEYVALDGGPSILLTTVPRFQLKIHERKKSRLAFKFAAKPFAKVVKPTFAPQSPAGRFLSRQSAALSGRGELPKFEFNDPHHGKGGLGASSAQFALVYAWANRIENASAVHWALLLEEYRACAWSGEGTPPSGADVVAQLMGGICWFDGRALKTERLEWKFPTLSFTLLRTGTKLATHEHLKKTQAIPFEILRECVALGKTAFLENDEAKLVVAVERYAGVLAEAGLTASATLGLLRALRTQASGVRAVKGCGAMGADVIAVLHDRAATAGIAAWAESKGLELCGGEAELSKEGLVAQ
jgi:mevalonate kinase